MSISHRKADRMGFRLQGDISFQSFLLSLINSSELKEIVQEIRESRPDILKEEFTIDETVEPEWKNEEATFAAITDALLAVTDHWVSTQDAVVLQESLSNMLKILKERKNRKE